MRAAFRRLNGRDPTAAETARIEKIASALEADENDAFLAVVVVHEHYLARFDTVPTRIEAAAKAAVDAARQTSDAAIKASAAAAHEALVKSVAGVADKIVSDSARRDMARWVVAATLVITVALTLTGWLAHRAGYWEGIGDAVATADLQQERASWANTPEGARAFRLYKAGDLRRLAECDAPGWTEEAGVCYPRAANDEKHSLHGWRVKGEVK